MKNTRYHLFAAAVLIIAAAACQKPEEILPSVPGKGINAFTVYTSWDAYHTADKNGWGSVIDYDAHTITVQVPYTWPVASDNVQKLEDYPDAWCQFNLDDNVYVEPSMMRIDLSKTYVINVTDQVKNVTQWTVGAELVKSTACEIESFTISETAVAAIVDKNSRKLMVAQMEPLEGVHADYVLSPHATISPDPATLAFDCSEESPMTFTVTAQDGVTSSEWTLELSVPNKYKAGVRPGSETLAWVKKMSEIGRDFNEIAGNTSSLAVSGDYLILNTLGAEATVLDAKTGAFVRTLNLGICQADATSNTCMTSDDNGHIVICSKSYPFKVYRMQDFDSDPELFIEAENTHNFSWRISVTGDVYGDAVITAAKSSSAKEATFAKWRVAGGVPESQIPEMVTVSDAAGFWTWKGDAVYASTEEGADYFTVGYSSNILTWADGTTNAVKSEISHYTANEQCTSIDATLFNGVEYVGVSMETSFTWGASGGLQVYEASSPATFTGHIPIAYASNEPPACLVYDLPRGDNGYGEYGSRMANGVCDGAYSDVRFQQSEDGFFLYAYFMFCNGYLGCVQFDCIAQ